MRDGLGDLALERGEQVVAGERPHVRGGREGVADHQCGDGGDEALFEFVGDRFVDEEALGADAALAGVVEAGGDGLRDGGSRSASASTMNGSEPPSSSTVFFSAWPASVATAAPARSLPVRVTAATRGSAIRAAVRSGHGGFADQQ